jgi:FixJ family two-component response regulator
MVVLVEDDDGLRNAVATMLATSGFRVMPFATAEAALAEVRWDAAACLIVDVRLPGMSGLDLIRRLPQRANKLPAVVITADERQATRDAAARLGVSAYLEKPVQGRAVIAAVRQAVGVDSLKGERK